jgi:hypothetical protein
MGKNDHTTSEARDSSVVKLISTAGPQAVNETGEDLPFLSEVQITTPYWLSSKPFQDASRSKEFFSVYIRLFYPSISGCSF